MPFRPLTEPVDYVELAHIRTPGLAEVKGAGSPRRWDERRGYGLNGAFVVFRGLKLAKFSILIRLYNDLDWEQWHVFRPQVMRMPRSTRDGAVSVSHPILEDLNIRSCSIVDVLQPMQEDHGVWVVEIQCLEFRRPELNLAAPDGADVAPPDREELEIEALTHVFNSLREQAQLTAEE